MTVSSKVRIYDLAKELKLDTKRLIEEVRREGVDVSVPSNSVSKELAEKIRNKYFPKKETTIKRAVKVVKRAVAPAAEAPVVEALSPRFTNLSRSAATGLSPRNRPKRPREARLPSPTRAATRLVKKIDSGSTRRSSGAGWEEGAAAARQRWKAPPRRPPSRQWWMKRYGARSVRRRTAHLK